MRVTTQTDIAVTTNIGGYNIGINGVDRNNSAIKDYKIVGLAVKEDTKLYCDNTNTWRNVPNVPPTSKLSAIKVDYYGETVLRLFAPYTSGSYGDIQRSDTGSPQLGVLVLVIIFLFGLQV